MRKNVYFYFWIVQSNFHIYIDIMPTLKSPTSIHTALRFAYDFYNRHLFHNQLPECLISLQRQAKSQGYFSSKRFVSEEGNYTDEIALNPEYFGVLPVIDTLSTLVHEMVHLWQQHFGKPGRRGYHNKEWADKMQSIGLMPSDTHKPGGKRTGEHMGDYILDHGLFLQVTMYLLQSEFALVWFDVYPPFSAHIGKSITHTAVLPLDESFKNPPAIAIENQLQPVVKQIDNSAVQPLFREMSNDSARPEPIRPENPAAYNLRTVLQFSPEAGYPSKKNTRNKYLCPGCQSAVWGRPNLRIQCMDCNEVFEMIEI